MGRYSIFATCLYLTFLAHGASAAQLATKLEKGDGRGFLSRSSENHGSKERSSFAKKYIATEGSLVQTDSQEGEALGAPAPEKPKEIECCNICPGQFIVASLFLQLPPEVHRATVANFAGWAAARGGNFAAGGVRVPVPDGDAPALLQTAARTANPLSWDTVSERYKLEDEYDKFGEKKPSKTPADAKGGEMQAMRVTSKGEDSPCCKICPAGYIPPKPKAFLQLAEQHGGVSALADAHRAVAACEARAAGDEAALQTCHESVPAAHRALSEASGLGVDPVLVELEAKTTAGANAKSQAEAEAKATTKNKAKTKTKSQSQATSTSATELKTAAEASAGSRTTAKSAQKGILDSVLGKKKGPPKVWCCVVCSVAFEPPRSWMDATDFLEIAEAAAAQHARRSRGTRADRAQRTQTGLVSQNGAESAVATSRKRFLGAGASLATVAAAGLATAVGAGVASTLKGGKDGEGNGLSCCSMCPISLVPLGSEEDARMRGKLKLALDKSYRTAASAGMLDLPPPKALVSVPVLADGSAAVNNPANKRKDYESKAGLLD